MASNSPESLALVNSHHDYRYGFDTKKSPRLFPGLSDFFLSSIRNIWTGQTHSERKLYFDSFTAIFIGSGVFICILFIAMAARASRDFCFSHSAGLKSSVLRVWCALISSTKILQQVLQERIGAVLPLYVRCLKQIRLIFSLHSTGTGRISVLIFMHAPCQRKT
jgi:hypothetical protein